MRAKSVRGGQQWEGGQDGCKRGAGVGHCDDKDPDKHILLNNAIASGTPLDKYNVKRSFPTNSHRISLIKMRPYITYELHFLSPIYEISARVSNKWFRLFMPWFL